MRAIIGSVILVCILFGAALNGQTIPVTSRQSAEKPILVVDFFLDARQHDKQFVVGEMIPCTLRCRYDAQHYIITSLLPPVQKDISFFMEQESTQQQVMIKDKTCIVQEWHGYVSMSKAGAYELGPFQVRGEQSSTHASRSFFRMQLNSSFSAYSNTVKVTVEALPESPLLTVQRGFVPVGNFYALTLECERLTMKTGEAQTVRLIVEGDGNAQLLQHPVLHLSPHLKWYPGEKKQEGSIRTVFEYVVQALEEGVITIPVQEFTYFKPDQHAYKTLKTISLRLSVTPGVVIQQIDQNGSEQPILEQPNQPEVSMVRSFSFSAQSMEIPRTVYIIIIFALWSVVLYLCISAPCKRIMAFFRNHGRYRLLLRKVNRGYQQYRLKGDSTMLYENFKGLRAMREIDNDRWHEFWNRLECRKFSNGPIAEIRDDEPLFLQEIEQWIQSFESHLWHI